MNDASAQVHILSQLTIYRHEAGLIDRIPRMIIPPQFAYLNSVDTTARDVAISLK